MASLALSQQGLATPTFLAAGSPATKPSWRRAPRGLGLALAPRLSPTFVGASLSRQNRLVSRAARRSSRICSTLTEERPVSGPENADEPAPSEEPVQQCKPIWWSDVVPRRYHPYIFNRNWSLHDKVFAAVMVLLHGTALFAPFTFSWDAFGVFAALYVLTGLGITLSYHRNLTHKSFKMPKPLEYFFAYCGIQALQGDPIEWISHHRYHHIHCDTDLDPHTPLDGFWYVHWGWLMNSEITDKRAGNEIIASDIAKDPFYKWIRRTYFYHPLALAGLLYAVGGFPYIVWGMALRTIWVYHITWAVNSAGHVWGGRPWNTGDLSTNNIPIGILALGEGWHNNHHAFEYSVRHGLWWWQLDITWLTICALEKLGLATNLLYPRPSDVKKMTKPVPAA